MARVMRPLPEYFNHLIYQTGSVCFQSTGKAILRPVSLVIKLYGRYTEARSMTVLDLLHEVLDVASQYQALYDPDQHYHWTMDTGIACAVITYPCIYIVYQAATASTSHQTIPPPSQDFKFLSPGFSFVLATNEKCDLQQAKYPDNDIGL